MMAISIPHALARHELTRRLLIVAVSLGLLASAISVSSASAQGNSRRLDLRDGAVFSMSNAPEGNAVVAFFRGPDGTLTPAGSYSTGGTGSGGFEDSANSLVLGSAQGEAAPNNIQSDGNLLFATNPGSNTISVFRIRRDRLQLVEVQDSLGEKPVSFTVNNGIGYVLNSGEFVDGLVPPNCASGNLPSVTGFTVSNSGRLTPIEGSTRQLSGDPFSGCAQVSFNPSGDVLVVTERTARLPEQAPDDEGIINTFIVNADGTLGEQRLFDATGQGPFGFTFNKAGALLTTEQFDGLMGPGEGAAAGYTVNPDGTLTATSPSVKNGGTDTCWFVVTDNGTFGFTTSFFPDARISSYLVGANGSLSLLDDEAADVRQGASDLSLSEDSSYLYQLNSFDGTISGFAVGTNGSLTLVQTVQAHAPSTMAAPLGLASS